jgi:hypothetical protein
MKPRDIILFLAGYSVLLAPYASALQPPVQAPERKVVVAPDADYSPQGGFFGTISLPAIVRYQNLPMRMYLDPLLPESVALEVLDSRLVPLWERMLREGTDPELVEVAAQSLARVAEMKLADIQPAEKSLQALAQNSENQRIRYAAGAALAIGDLQSSAPLLIKLAEAGNDAQRLRIEPSLIRWKTSAALELWKARLLDASTTIVSFQLATEGLVSINHGESVEVLLSITADPVGTYPKRMAAARAAAILSSDRALSAAEPLSGGNVQDRMLALALLNTEKPEALVKAATFCTDISDGVASVAWQQVFDGNSELLLTHLETGRKHRDAQVRITAAKTMRLWANSDRAMWLQELLSDIHIEVRNVARTMLVLVAAEHPELKEQIVAQAAAMLKPESADWQGMEQSLLVLAQLQATQFSATAFALLGHTRDEVVVTAAWLIQLFPDDAIRGQVQAEIEQCEGKFSGGETSTNDVSLREMMLLQYAGLVRLKELQPILEQQFSKSARGSPQKRASALWALAVIHEKTADEALAKKYEERIQDRNSIPPEALPVRRSSVMALGLLRCRNSLPVLMEAYKIDPPDSGIPDTVRWVFPLLGQPMLPEIATSENGVSGWRITPVD